MGFILWITVSFFFSDLQIFANSYSLRFAVSTLEILFA